MPDEEIDIVEFDADTLALSAALAAEHEQWSLAHGDTIWSNADLDRLGGVAGDYSWHSADASATPADEDSFSEAMGLMLNSFDTNSATDRAARRLVARRRFVTRPEYIMNIKSSDIDLNGVQSDWEDALTVLLEQWATQITPAQYDEIAYQVREAVTNHDLSALANLSVSSHQAASLLEIAMDGISEDGAASMVEEAAKQDVTVAAGHADRGIIAAAAALLAALLAAGLANAAAREALRVYYPGAKGDDVAAAVRMHMDGLSDAYLRQNLGGILSRAQHDGRMATLKVAPEASMYSSEILDKVICKPCREVSGKFLGLSSNMTQVDQLYPNGQYKDCLGGVRCRGQVVAVWRPAQVGGNE